MNAPLIAIVGAPNAGKSTLFNRVLGRRKAIVTDQPGMTRDRLYGLVEDAAHPFRLVDTGGLTPGTDAPFAREISAQAEAAMAEAALILFVVDARAGATGLDHDLAVILRKTGRPLLLVANKVDGPKVEASIHDLHTLGLGPALAVSAEHGSGINDLMEAIEAHLDQLPVPPPADEPSDTLAVAIVGRPNVGKSSIFNRLVGEDRVMVSDVPGTTRDAIDTILEVEGARFRLIDTAGLRRRGRIERGPERFSVQRAHESIDRCDVAILVLDATESLAAQDLHIAGHVVDAYKPLLVAVNKWDLLDDRKREADEWEERIRRGLRFAKNVPFVFVSARTGSRVLRLLDEVRILDTASRTRVPTPELNTWLRSRVDGDPDAPPPRNALRLFYATQAGTRPPRFIVFCNDPRRVHFSVRRNLENSLRERFGFGAAPIRLQFRSRRPAG